MSLLTWKRNAKPEWFKSFETLGPNLDTLMSGIAVPESSRKSDHMLLFKSLRIQDGIEHMGVMYVDKDFVKTLIGRIRCSQCRAQEQIGQVDRMFDRYDKRGGVDSGMIPILIMAHDDSFSLGFKIPTTVDTEEEREAS
jgi:hypothetical protein